jgi:hypothetical protein
MVWHHDRQFVLIVDAAKGTFRFLPLLPGVPRAMYAGFRDWLSCRRSPGLPDHAALTRVKSIFRLFP